MTIKAVLLQAASTLKVSSETSRLDAEILMAHVLQEKQSYLYAHDDETLSDEQLSQFNDLIERRRAGEPVAYILGEKDFWDCTFKVNKNVLIPRPETELLVDYVLMHFDDKPHRLLDLGTGSGCIAVSIAKHRSDWDVVATDVLGDAILLAGQNAALNDVKNVRCVQSDWYETLDEKLFDIIVSNPPYIASDDPALEEAVRAFEPREALLAADDGLAAIAEIVDSARAYLKPEGVLMIEHGYLQADVVRACFEKSGFRDIQTLLDLQGHVRVTFGFVA